MTETQRYIIVFLSIVALMLLSTDRAKADLIPADEIKSAVNNYILELAEEAGIEVVAEVPFTVDIEVNGIGKPVINVSVLSGRTISARTPVRVELCDVEGNVLKTLQITARVKIFKIVAVVCNDMKRGDSFSSLNIKMENKDVSGIKDYFEDISELDCMRTNRILRPDKVVTGKNVERIPVICRGDKVTIKAKTANVVATVEGTARQDGGKGDSIRVYNLMSRRIFECRVIDEKTVEIVL